jgi:NarL family two-component system sensor histidine kinase YdfH
LHWSLFFIGEDEKWFWPYVITQGFLAFFITHLSQNIGMLFALFMALIGEIIGSERRKSWKLFAVIYFIFLSLINYVNIYGTETSGWWLIGTLPMIIFVTMYVSLYTRASNDRDKAQKLFKELEIAHSKLAEYTNQVEELTLTTERQRMARELHDTLAQGLAGLILQLEAADSHLSNQSYPKAQTIVQQAMTRARTTLADARHAIENLRDDSSASDLKDQIQVEVERFKNITGIACDLDLSIPPELTTQIADHARRVVSESLINIARHAAANRVSLQISYNPEVMSIEIQDNGIGFLPDEAVGSSGHFGLLGLRERARILGGSLVIESQPTKGTKIKLQLPLSHEKLVMSS